MIDIHGKRRICPALAFIFVFFVINFFDLLTFDIGVDNWRCFGILLFVACRFVALLCSYHIIPMGLTVDTSDSDELRFHDSFR